jgi:hypothetical protein
MSDVQTGEVAPVVPAEPAATPENVAPATPPTEGEPPVEAQVPKTFTQDELNAIVQKEKAKAEAKAARKVESAYREALQRTAPTQQEQQRAPAAPKREDFATDEEWVDAKVDFKLNERQNAEKQSKQQEHQAKLAKSTEELIDKASKIAGFDQDAFEELPIQKVMADAILESEFGPQILAQLTANPSEAARIAALSPARQAAEMASWKRSFLLPRKSAKHLRQSNRLVPALVRLSRALQA